MKNKVNKILVLFFVTLTIGFSENYSVHFDFMSGYSESLTSSTNIFGGIQPFTVEAWYKNEGVNTGANSGYDDGANIVSSYRRSGGGDPYGNFNFGINPGDSENSGKGFADHGVITNERMDDGAWHHLAATYEPNVDGSWSFRLYLDGVLNDQNTSPSEGYDHTSSNNNIRMNNHSPFAGDHMLDCSYAGMSITNGAKYTENFSPQFPLISDGNTIVNLDFSQGGGNQLIDNSGNGNHFNLYGNYQWGSDVPTEPVYGCTDSYADNFNSEATSDDGSCSGYPDDGEYSLSFDNDNVSIDDIGDYSSKVTIMAWMKKDGTNGYSNIVSGGCGNLLFTENDNKLLFGSQCSNPIAHDTYGTTDITDNIWHHVAATYDAGAGQNNLKVYVDGVLDGQSTKTGLFNVNSFRIGSNNGGDGEQYNGNIDMLRIWNTALTQEQIQENMNSSVASVETGLLADWKFNSGDGDVLYDHSGNQNHGTINGATWSGDGAPVEQPFLGCTDPYAENYDSEANIDDGSCSYPDNGEYSLSFDGIDDYVEMDESQLDDLFKDYNPFTISTWLKRSSEQSANDHLNIFSKGTTPNSEGQNPRGVMILTHVSGDITFILYSAPYDFIYVSASNFLNTDSWDHISATYDGGSSPQSLKLYKNGSLYNNVSYGSNGDYTGIIATDGQPTILGARVMDNGNTHLPFIGNINDFSIWSEALTGAQIQSINENDYEIGANLVGKWGFSEGEGQSLFDHSGNQNHGLINGPTWSDSVPYNGPFYVSTEGSDENQGSEGSPFATIQKAINSSVINGNEIFVYPGVYQEKLLLENKDLTIRSTDSLEYDYDSSGVVNANVVIEGSYDGTIITINGGNYNFEGLLIRYGRSDVGGGIRLENADLMLHNCMVESNQTAGQGSKGAGIYSYNSRLNIELSTINYNNADDSPGIGGGVYFENDGVESDFNFHNSVMINNNANGGSGGGLYMNNQGYYTQAQIENSIFDSNTTADHGGGIYSDGQIQLNIYNSEIINNSAAGEGGGVNASDADLHMEETSVLWNSAGDTGGGLRFFNGNQNLVNTVIANNAASVEGGGIKFTGSSPSIDFCTIANNTSNVCAGGVVAVYNQVYIRNSIVYGNGAGSLCTIQGGSFDVSYSNIEGGYDGEENINADPLFCDADGDNFTLAQNSSSLNASEDGQNIGAEGVGCEAAYLNNALSFDGQNSYVDVPGLDNIIDDKISIGLWVKPLAENQYQTLFRQEDNIPRLLIQYYDGAIYWGAYTENGWDEVSAPYNQQEYLNNWNFLTVVYDGFNKKIYLNGLEIGSNSNSTGNIVNNGEPLNIGRHTNGNENYNGFIDDVSIWSIALDQQEIQSNMNQELIGNEEGLIRYWNFNEVQNSTVRDITGNGYNGTVYGAELSGDSAPIDPPPAIYGCNDPYAENYDLYANNNDGTCEYSQEPVTFTKEDYADVSLEENQDRITASVWITRGDNQPLYNAAFESYSDHGVSPSGTIWASGQTALQTSINGYQSFREATGGNHNNLPGRIMSMYIIQENLFYDVEFHSWTSNNNGGGFSYTRTPAEINSFDYGPNAIYFEKQDYADWNNVNSQDRITDSTWITRGNQQGIFNAFSEQNYEFNSGDEIYSAPSNTLWAYGSTDEASEQDYKPFKSAVRDSFGMQDLPGHTFSLFIISDNLYFDVEFHSWTSNGNGGGFSYTRTDENGNRVTFTKEDYADHTLEENQDRISEGVWITREDYHPLFNFAQEQNYYDSPSIYLDAYGSPENTEWSFGRTDNLSLQNYQPWQAAIGGHNPRGAIGRFMSLHIISEDIYFDVVFHSWTCCGEGGGFSYTRIPINNDDEQTLNGSISGIVSQASDSSGIEGAHVIAVAEDNSYSFDTYSDSSGYYNLELVGPLNYYISISYEGLITHNEYLFIGPFENTELNVSLGVMQSAIVEGTLTDWYTNAPLLEASALFAYTNDDGEMETIESVTDENGYFMVQVPGEQDYDLFLYADGYWVEHDAFFLGSGENQVLSIGIPPINSAARLYGTVKDIESGDLIPYAEVQLNCDQASDWDHTGDIGTYRVFNYYLGDCDNGVLVVSADGYETSIQSVGGIDFEIGSSSDLEVTLMQGDDPDPGMVSGTVYSNIDGNPISQAEIQAYNVSTTQLFSINTYDDGSYQLFLPEADYYLSVNAQYHAESFDTLSIVSAQSYTRDFNLDQVPEFRISGVVSDQSGSPLSGFETFVTNGNGYRTTFTNEDGEYEIYVPNGIYDVGSGSNDYSINFVSGIEVQDNDVVVNIVLENIQEFDGGFAGIVHLNDGDSSIVNINVWDSDLTYNAYVSTDENGAFTLPLVNGRYTIYAWVPNSEYESIYIPDAFTVENNIISYDLYFIAPEGPDAPTIVFLEDVPNDQGGQLELAWTPGEPREYEIFPQYSVWRMEDGWNLIATVPYHGYDLYNMIVPTLGDSTADGIFESTFMVTAHTLDQNTFFDSDPLTGYSVDNIFPGIPQQLVATLQGESVDLEWNISEAEDLSHYNVYRQNQSLEESALVFVSENNFYSDNVGTDGDFQYWVTAVDLSGNESDASEPAMVTLGIVEGVLPLEFALLQNYPNPFNPSTQIMYTLPKTSSVKIVIYDMLGSKVRTLFSGSQDAGYKNVLWNATNDQGDPVSAGMYIYTIEAESFFASKKMILLK